MTIIAFVMLIMSSCRTVQSLIISSSSTILSHLRNPSLLQDFLRDSSTDTFPVHNPAHPEQVLGHLPKNGRKDTQQAIAAASEALPLWRDGVTASTRAQKLKQWHSLIHENRQDLATIMTLESGKPLKESIGEVAYGNSFVEWFAAEALRQHGAGGGFQMPTPFAMEDGAPRGKVLGVHQAVGVAALITPWNFPLAMITRKAAPALAAGCTTVIKPSELTPLTALALQHLAREAGIPPDAMHVITAVDPTDIGHECCTNPAVAKISFTGSTGVGKQLLEWSSSTVKRASMELGGNAPFIVFEDANLEQAVNAAVASKFRNAGQTCVCSDRFLIHESIHDEFVGLVTKKIDETIQVGDGMLERTTMGPLITRSAALKTHERVQSAVKEGAKCVYGDVNESPNGQFHKPIVLTDVETHSSVWREENFGPVMPIRSFRSEEEALTAANDLAVGLASYFCTQDLSRAFRFAERLETGLVGVNEGIISTCVAPFGGVKESGLGREGGSLGLAEYLETKYIFINI